MDGGHSVGEKYEFGLVEAAWALPRLEGVQSGKHDKEEGIHQPCHYRGVLKRVGEVLTFLRIEYDAKRFLTLTKPEQTSTFVPLGAPSSKKICLEKRP